jgi:hypothetical protein
LAAPRILYTSCLTKLEVSSPPCAPLALGRRQAATNDIADIPAELGQEDVAAKMVQAYRSDLTGFARWFEGATDEAFCAGPVTPTSVRDSKSYLVSVERRQPATVHRKLAAVRRFSVWAKAAGRATEIWTERVR